MNQFLNICKDIFTTFTLMFLAVFLALTYFGGAAFYTTALVAKIAVGISLLYTVGKYVSKVIARAVEPEEEPVSTSNVTSWTVDQIKSLPGQNH